MAIGEETGFETGFRFGYGFQVYGWRLKYPSSAELDLVVHYEGMVTAAFDMRYPSIRNLQVNLLIRSCLNKQFKNFGLKSLVCTLSLLVSFFVPACLNTEPLCSKLESLSKVTVFDMISKASIAATLSLLSCQVRGHFTTKALLRVPRPTQMYRLPISSFARHTECFSQHRKRSEGTSRVN